MAKSKAGPPPARLTLVVTSACKKDLKRQGKGGKDMAKLRAVIETLCQGRPLEPRHQDHPLGGTWKGWRDCHIEPDWILIYRKSGSDLELGRTGSHSDLFG